MNERVEEGFNYIKYDLDRQPSGRYFGNGMFEIRPYGYNCSIRDKVGFVNWLKHFYRATEQHEYDELFVMFEQYMAKRFEQATPSNYYKRRYGTNTTYENNTKGEN